MFAFYESLLSEASAYAGISAQLYKKSNTYSSGYAMQLARIDILDKTSSQIPQYQNALKRLLEMIRDTINIYTVWNINTQINVSIQMPQTYTNRMQQLQIIQKELQIGIKTLQDYGIIQKNIEQKIQETEQTVSKE